METNTLKLPLSDGSCRSVSQVSLMSAGAPAHPQQTSTPMRTNSSFFNGSPFKFASSTLSEYSAKLSNTSHNISLRLRRDRWFSKRSHRRLVCKNGDYNVSHDNIKKRRQRYLADIFTTLVDIKWRWNLLIFVLAFMLSWLIFALVWWLICFSHGDFMHNHEEGWEVCVEEVNDFTTALLFSIETQHTIGYGGRQTTSHCPEAIFVMMLQSCFGVIIQALMTGLVFAKLSRPKKRAETLMFSKTAIVCQRDGDLCLLFRVGDMRKSHIVEAHVRALLIRSRTTAEGEVLPLSQHELKLGELEDDNRLFLVWPVILEHRITDTSPLWDISAADLKCEQFELIVILEGVVECTGMTTQARTSYLPNEIMWGERFERLVNYNKEAGQYIVDYSRFHATIPVRIPQCSAMSLATQTTFTNETASVSSSGVDEDAPPTPIVSKNNNCTGKSFNDDSVEFEDSGAAGEPIATPLQSALHPS